MNPERSMMRGVFAEREGFEPSIPCGMTDYQSAAFSHSAISVDAPPNGRLNTNGHCVDFNMSIIVSLREAFSALADHQVLAGDLKIV